MVPSDPCGPACGSDDDTPDEDLSDFLGLLNELKSTGCNLLLVGDAPRRLFTRASHRMLGADDETRYRILAVTDATPQSVADRLPDPAESPRPISETTHVLNHVGSLRSITDATEASTPPKLVGVKETRVVDPKLEGLQSALVDAISTFANHGYPLRPSDLRVGLDSLEPLLDFYDENVVRQCLRTVGQQARTHDAMAHYVLPQPYDSDVVQTLANDVEAVVELRLSDSMDGTGEQRWLVPGKDMQTNWATL